MNTPHRRSIASRAVVGATVALLLSAALSGCSLLEPIRAEPKPTPTKTDRPYIPTPDGFTRAGDVAYRWVEQGTVACLALVGCYHVDVYAFIDCPAGVSFEAELRDGDNFYHSTVIGTTIGTLPNLSAGDTGRIELPATVPGGWAFLYEARCS